MLIHKDSHVDHGLTQSQIDFLVSLFADRDAFFIETVELPEELGTVACGLHGPAMGDAPIPDNEIFWYKRGNREYTSRMCHRGMRQVRTVSVIAGPHDGHACVLYTAFGGPVAPQEFNDPTCKDLLKSQAFWSEHALGTEEHR